jgi:hypothetical protein
MARLLADVMERLGEITEALQKIYEFARAVMIAVQNIGNAGSVADTINGMDIDTGGVDLTATYEWQIYQLRATAALEMPVSLGVDYARDLQLAVDEVSIYGQALAAAQLAVITAGQEYAAIRLKQELAVEQHKRLQSLIDDLVEGQKPTDALMQEFYQRYIDAKSSLFSALQGYRASFFYWALRHSSVNPRIIDGVDTLDAGLKDLTAIALDEANALNNFSPPPQVMRQRLVTVTDPAEDGGHHLFLRHPGRSGFRRAEPEPADAGAGVAGIRPVDRREQCGPTGDHHARQLSGPVPGSELPVRLQPAAARIPLSRVRHPAAAGRLGVRKRYLRLCRDRRCRGPGSQLRLFRADAACRMAYRLAPGREAGFLRRDEDHPGIRRIGDPAGLKRDGEELPAAIEGDGEPA